MHVEGVGPVVGRRSPVDVVVFGGEADIVGTCTSTIGESANTLCIP